jgi:hypothetical protein
MFGGLLNYYQLNIREGDYIMRKSASKNGGNGWIRTTDQGLMSPLLYH